MRIMTFSQFLNESIEGGYSSFDALPKSVKNFFISAVGKNILSKVIGLKNFSISIEGEEIYFNVNGNKILVPFINYVNDVVVPNEKSLGDKNVVDNFYKTIGINQYLGWIDYYHREIYNKIQDYSIGKNRRIEIIEDNLNSIFYGIFTQIRDLVKDDKAQIIINKLKISSNLDNRIFGELLDLVPKSQRARKIFYQKYYNY